ncbi:MAG: hypothetical protein WKF86_10580 [Acidimicrobiales bacterium]
MPGTENVRRSALPSVRARALAFVAIALGGGCGGLIGWAFVNLQCTGACEVPKAIGAVSGSLLTSIGIAVIAVLGLRAMGEWRRLQDQ